MVEKKTEDVWLYTATFSTLDGPYSSEELRNEVAIFGYNAGIDVMLIDIVKETGEQTNKRMIPGRDLTNQIRHGGQLHVLETELDLEDNASLQPPIVELPKDFDLNDKGYGETDEQH